LGARAAAARKSQYLDKRQGMIRNPDILHATIKRKIDDSGITAARAFAKFRHPSRKHNIGSDYVILLEDLKKALVHLQINATASCVEMLFRYMDVDDNKELDFNEFTEAVMMSSAHAADIIARDAMKRSAQNSDDDSFDVDSMQEYRKTTKLRMEQELCRRLELAKNQNIDAFMASMRRRLGKDCLSSHDSEMNVMKISHGHNKNRTKKKKHNNNNDNDNNGQWAITNGVIGRGSKLHQASLLPNVTRSQVSKKAAASAQRAKRLIQDRDPRAAYYVQQASLAPQYAKSPTVLASVHTQRT
jgi:hypothetical protein